MYGCTCTTNRCLAVNMISKQTRWRIQIVSQYKHKDIKIEETCSHLSHKQQLAINKAHFYKHNKWHRQLWSIYDLQTQRHNMSAVFSSGAIPTFCMYWQDFVFYECMSIQPASDICTYMSRFTPATFLHKFRHRP